MSIFQNELNEAEKLQAEVISAEQIEALEALEASMSDEEREEYEEHLAIVAEIQEEERVDKAKEEKHSILEYPNGKRTGITFEYSYRDKENVIALAKTDRYRKLMERLAFDFPAWKTEFSQAKSDYKFSFRNERTTVRDFGGYPRLEIWHEEDIFYALFLAAEMIAYKNVLEVEIITTNKDVRSQIEDELRRFGIKTDNVKTEKPSRKEKGGE